jgi:hypothetical protein
MKYAVVAAAGCMIVNVRGPSQRTRLAPRPPQAGSLDRNRIEEFRLAVPRATSCATRNKAACSSAAVAFVEYTPSPEARYPVAIEQGYATAQWITREAYAAKLRSAGDGFLIPPRVPHNATDLGPGTGQMLSTYIVDIGQPIATFTQ